MRVLKGRPCENETRWSIHIDGGDVERKRHVIVGEGQGVGCNPRVWRMIRPTKEWPHHLLWKIAIDAKNDILSLAKLHLARRIST